MKKKDLKISFVILLLTILYGFSGLFLRDLNVDVKLRWLFWNLLLAYLPLLFAIIFAFLFSKKHWFIKLIAIPFLFAWLIFLPNSPYLITDLIHLDSSGIINWNYTYNTNLRSWLSIIYLSAGIILGFVTGLVATQFVLKNIKWTQYPIVKIIVNFILSMIVGYGVYIGRFLRFNSWDLIHPRSLLITLISDFNKFTIIFSFVIGIVFFSALTIYQKVEEK